MTALGRVLAYQRPFRTSVASVGLVATAPASVSFLLATLVVSALWRDPPGAHLAVAACCAWRATDLPRGPLLPLLGSAFLVRRPVEAVWTVAATWLVLGPLEAVVGTRRLLVLGALGHALPTILVDLCWLAGGLAGQGLDGLDVGTSAVVVTAAAALAVTTRSLPVAAVLVTGLMVDIVAAPDLATTEHLIAVVIGVSLAMAFSRERRGATPVVAIPDDGGQQPGPRDRHLRDPAVHPSAGRRLVARREAAGMPVAATAARAAIELEREAVMQRRRFLSHTIAGAVGLVAGGAVLGSGELDRAELEHDDSAIPDGPARALGRRQLIWAVPTSAPLAALTFDDGPDPELTPRILAILARYDVRATFNLMGYNASRHRDLVRALVGGGHELGNHTWSHEDLAFQSPAATFRQLERGLIAVERAAGVPPRFFRPPRGELTGAALQAAAQLGHDVLLWSVTRGPAGVGTPRAVADHLAVAIGPGDVVGLHDGIGRGTFDRGGVHARVLEARRRVELAALPAAIEAVLTRNLKLITATELLDAPATASPPDSGGA